MGEIRALQRGDLPDVASLYEMVMRSGRPHAPPALAGYFERTLLDQPWADPDIPSLVYTGDDGSIVAFQGSGVRRGRWDGEAIRIACAGQLVAHPQARHRGVGARLLRAYLDGPQELTITDTANEPMRQLWMLLGGDMIHLSCIGWVRVLRPWRAGEAFLREYAGKWRRPLARRLLPLLDSATGKWIRAASPPDPPAATGETLTPSVLVENSSLVTDGVRLHLDYDEPYVRWLFDQLAIVSGYGSPVARLVRANDGRVLGWYVYYLQAEGPARVLQVAAPERDIGRVLDHLLHDAWQGGAPALVGRVEPRLLEPLARRRCLMHYGPNAALAHSRHPEVIGAIASGKSLLTRLDGEWWMQDRMVDLGHEL